MKTTTRKTTRVVDLRRMRRPPTHPGEMLLEEFLKPLGLTQADYNGAQTRHRDKLTVLKK